MAGPQVPDVLGRGAIPTPPTLDDNLKGGGLSSIRKQDLGQRGRTFEIERRPLVLTCLSWQLQSRYIFFWANPKDLTWNFKLRGTTHPVKGGTISYIWRDSSRQVGAPLGSSFYDEPKLNITFQTGNCMPVRIETGAAPGADQQNSITTTAVARMPPGLLDLYEFLELMNEPMVLDDGSMNYRILYYNSILFPNIVLYGWFQPEQEFSFTESSEDPAQVQWSHTFIVRRSTPPFMNAAALAYAFQVYSLGVSGIAPQPLGGETTGNPGNQTNPGNLNPGQPAGQSQDQLEKPQDLARQDLGQPENPTVAV